MQNFIRRDVAAVVSVCMDAAVFFIWCGAACVSDSYPACPFISATSDAELRCGVRTDLCLMCERGPITQQPWFLPRDARACQLSGQYVVIRPGRGRSDGVVRRRPLGGLLLLICFSGITGVCCWPEVTPVLGSLYIFSPSFYFRD